MLRLHIDAEFYNFTVTETFWRDGGKGKFGWAAMYGIHDYVGLLCCMVHTCYAPMLSMQLKINIAITMTIRLERNFQFRSVDRQKFFAPDNSQRASHARLN